MTPGPGSQAGRVLHRAGDQRTVVQYLERSHRHGGAGAGGGRHLFAGVSMRGPAAGMGPWLVGSLVWGIGLSLGGTTGYAINPARDLRAPARARARAHSRQGRIQLALCADSDSGRPLIGAALAGLLMRSARLVVRARGREHGIGCILASVLQAQGDQPRHAGSSSATRRSQDNVLVALATLDAGTEVRYGSATSACPVTQTIPAKHKMALEDLKPGDLVLMYGMVVGEVVEPIPRGGLITTRNIRHRAADYTAARQAVRRSRCPMRRAWAGRTLHGLSPRRRPGGHAQLLARAAAGVLREPQRGADAGGA